MLYGLQNVCTTNAELNESRVDSRAGVRNVVKSCVFPSFNSHGSKTIEDLCPRPRPKRAGQPATPKETQEALNVHEIENGCHDDDLRVCLSLCEPQLTSCWRLWSLDSTGTHAPPLQSR